jgi:hypothetical protein
MGRRKTAVSSLAKPPPQPTLVIVLLSLLRADFSAYLFAPNDASGQILL